MKKIFLLCVLLLSITSIAQKREENKVFEIVAKSPKLTMAKGWMKNETTGKWVENKNVIATKKVYSTSEISHYLQNFEWIQIAKIARDNEAYYVIIYRKVHGYYEYEGYDYLSGWTPTKITRFAIITSSDYKFIKSKIQYKEGIDYPIKAAIDRRVFKSLTESINSSISTIEGIGSKITTHISSPSFLFNSQSIDDKDTVRFRLEYNYFTKHKPQGIADIDTNENLNQSYFEVSMDEFSKLLID